jgi:hypothetical protein
LTLLERKAMLEGADPAQALTPRCGPLTSGSKGFLNEGRELHTDPKRLALTLAVLDSVMLDSP